MSFHDIRVFVFGYRPQNENPEIRGNLYFWVYKVQMHMDLFFDHYFNVLGAKTKINKNVLNLIKQTPGAWLMWFIFGLMWFEEHLNWFWSYILIIQYYNVFVAFLCFPSFRICMYYSKRKLGNHGKFLCYHFLSQTLSNLLFCFSFFIFIARICNSLVQLLFPWFPWFPGFRPGPIYHCWNFPITWAFWKYYRSNKKLICQFLNCIVKKHRKPAAKCFIFSDHKRKKQHIRYSWITGLMLQSILGVNDKFCFIKKFSIHWEEL